MDSIEIVNNHPQKVSQGGGTPTEYRSARIALATVDVLACRLSGWL